MTDVDILTAGGLVNADAIVEGARLAGVPLHIAAAVIQKETHGRNVYGNDKDGTVATPGAPDLEVTAENYAQFYDLVINQGAKSNGVGPAQITYGAYHPQAKAQGLDLSNPVDNITFGLRIVARNLAGDHSPANIERAGTLYNAGNLRAGITAYGRDLAAKAAAWRALLEPPVTPVTPDPLTADTGEPMPDVKDSLTALGWRTDTPARTTQAVKDFQRGWNLGPELVVDGIPGPKTLAALDVSLKRKAARLPDFSEHFSAVEFRCACGGYDDCRRIWADRELVRACEAYRTLVGPLSIVRGCRCPRENKRVGGATRSQHLFGRAVDVPIFDVTLSDVKTLKIVRGVGLYDWQNRQVVRHIDVRPENSWLGPAQWDYGNATSAPLKPQPAKAPAPVVVKPAPKPPAPKPVVPKFPGTTRRGDKGASVLAVQKRLKARGWKVSTDASFGPALESVVKKFQKEKKLTADGVVGAKTWAALWASPIT